MKSFVPWIGGKTLLTKTIISYFPNANDYNSNAVAEFYKKLLKEITEVDN